MLEGNKRIKNVKYSSFFKHVNLDARYLPKTCIKVEIWLAYEHKTNETQATHQKRRLLTTIAKHLRKKRLTWVETKNKGLSLKNLEKSSEPVVIDLLWHDLVYVSKA